MAPKTEFSDSGRGADSGSVRLRERRVRPAGAFATEHAEEFGFRPRNAATVIKLPSDN